MKLVEIVNGLDVEDELKSTYTNLAAIFEEDIEKNITKSHFELEKATGIPYDMWGAFMNVVEVAGWINTTMRSIAAVGERRLIQRMGAGDVEAKEVNSYKAIKDYNAENSDVDNSNIVIMYIDPKEE